MALSVPAYELNDGNKHLALGFGTYKVGVVPASASGASAAAGPEPSAKDVVRDALSAGYRFLDCAEFYQNEAGVGEGIRAAGIPRSSLYIAGKVWTSTIYAGPAAVRAQVQKSIADLGCDYLDLVLIHWPVPGKHVAAYRELEACRRDGLIKSIGVSNYTVEDYQELTAEGSGVTVPPAVNQIEVNPFLYRRDTLSFFQGHKVLVQSYRALRDGKAFDHPVVVEVSKAVGRTPAQVLGRWCLQKGCAVIAKTRSKARMEENAQVFGWELSPEHMAKLDTLTTPEALENFRALYLKCIVRDTPLADDPSALPSRTITIT